ncbi:MAG: uracil-DNA glycosylase [Xanthobacteraceae bacterium]|nr:uracil-DNA glycosylase [Xanthobacteraceae bacterium]
MNAAELQAVLAFYVESGVDAVLQEEPVDRLTGDILPAAAITPGSVAVPDPPERTRMAREPAARPAVAVPPPVVGPQAARMLPGDPTSPAEAIMAARELARRAASLEELRSLLQAFEGCGLRKTAKQLVFAAGNPQARVMFVGEAPGRDEDLEGLPFVGRSGQLLDRMMAAIGLDRTNAYIANVIPWRPPGNRTPTPQETEVCLPFTLRQIELANPDILVCLGGPSAQTLLGIKEGIRRSRGRWLAYHTGSREIRAIATFHPAYLLRNPIEKRFVWRDLLAIRKALGELPAG